MRKKLHGVQAPYKNNPQHCPDGEPQPNQEENTSIIPTCLCKTPQVSHSDSSRINGSKCVNCGGIIRWGDPRWQELHKPNSYTNQLTELDGGALMSVLNDVIPANTLILTNTKQCTKFMMKLYGKIMSKLGTRSVEVDYVGQCPECKKFRHIKMRCDDCAISNKSKILGVKKCS